MPLSLSRQFVRGVSGGERKRVSIAEMMTTRARVQSWDGSTRGLDAATAVSALKTCSISVSLTCLKARFRQITANND